MNRKLNEYPNVNPFNDKKKGRIIGWWSGGVASAVACYLAFEHYGEVDLVFCDTGIEHPDTHRFMHDYENKFGVKIKKIKNEKFNEPEDVWMKYNGLNFAHGSPCSTMLKKEPRLKYQDIKNDFGQIFGFDFDKKEMKRADNMLINNPDLNPIFPLIIEKYDREKIFNTVKSWGIKKPVIYNNFLNNNCIGSDDSPKGGCVQGGIGYWQKMKKIYPKKFDYMAKIEHELSIKNGKPITICKDQRKGKIGNRLFLKHCEHFPQIEDIFQINGKLPVTIFECNGFCSTQQTFF